MEPLETCCATVSRGSQLFEAPFTVLSCASSWPTRQTDLASARALLPLLLARPAQPHRTPALPDNSAVPATTRPRSADRKSVVSGKSVSVRVDLGGRRIIQKKKITR